jgi:hypothetical protein
MPLATTTVVIKSLPVVVHNGGSDLTTTILAVVGVVLAIGSLVWQAWTFRLSGSRVRFTIQVAMLDRVTGEGIGLPDMTTDQELGLRRQGLTHPVLTVVVKNSGRSPTSVRSVKVVYSNDVVFIAPGYDPALPFRLDAESEQTWRFERSHLVEYSQALGMSFSTAVRRPSRRPVAAWRLAGVAFAKGRRPARPVTYCPRCHPAS